MIFIDASKGNNINFFNKYSHNLRDYGIIVTDNLSFHGLVEDESLIMTKNQRGIVRKIKDFITFLDIIKSRSFYDYNIEINSKDKILTLSSCMGDDSKRVVLHAKLLNN